MSKTTTQDKPRAAAPPTTGLDFEAMQDEIERCELDVMGPDAHTLAEAIQTANAASLAACRLASLCRVLVAEVKDLRERVEKPDTPTTREMVALITGAGLDPTPWVGR